MNKLIIAAAALLGGCAGSPLHIGTMSDAELGSVSSSALCNAYYAHHNLAAQAELVSRQDIPYHEWGDIRNHQISTGMSELGLICSWGWPNMAQGGRINRHSYGKQYVYGNGQYVYVEGGKVSAWQHYR